MKNKFVLIISFFLSVQACFSGDILAEKFFKDKTDIAAPADLRDPFISATVGTAQTLKDLAISKAVKQDFSNISAPMISQISEIKIVGIIIGPDKRAMAMVDKKAMVLREGMKIGSEGAELKAILPGGVIFVEKIVNIYGGEEFLESVIPVSFNSEK